MPNASARAKQSPSLLTACRALIRAQLQAKDRLSNEEMQLIIAVKNTESEENDEVFTEHDENDVRVACSIAIPDASTPLQTLTAHCGVASPRTFGLSQANMLDVEAQIAHGNCCNESESHVARKTWARSVRCYDSPPPAPGGRLKKKHPRKQRAPDQETLPISPPRFRVDARDSKLSPASLVVAPIAKRPQPVDLKYVQIPRHYGERAEC